MTKKKEKKRKSRLQSDNYHSKWKFVYTTIQLLIPLLCKKSIFKFLHYGKVKSIKRKKEGEREREREREIVRSCLRKIERNIRFREMKPTKLKVDRKIRFQVETSSASRFLSSVKVQEWTFCSFVYSLGIARLWRAQRQKLFTGNSINRDWLYRRIFELDSLKTKNFVIRNARATILRTERW